MPTTLDELIAHLTRVSRLDSTEANRVLEEIHAYYGEPLEGFVRRRHAELQAEGLSNSAIYENITRELETHRFPAPALSERQIRRLIYG